MSSILTLALPFFGLIGLGYFCGRVAKHPEAGLAWMNFFIVYVALPALFFKLIAPTPFEQLGNWPYVVGTTLSTYLAFCFAFVVGLVATGGLVPHATIRAVAGSYANVGYMGPGLTIAALGQEAVVPTALIFVFDCVLFFTLVPFLMALGGSERLNLWDTTKLVVRRVATHPFNVATVVAVIAAYYRFEPPGFVDTMLTFLKNAAAPCALFTMGVTIALRPARGLSPDTVPLLVIKLVVHPLLVWVILSWIGNFGPVWTYTAILMAALPPALNTFVMASQYRTDMEGASRAILFGTLVSVVTVTGLLVLIADGRLPYDLFP